MKTRIAVVLLLAALVGAAALVWRSRTPAPDAEPTVERTAREAGPDAPRPPAPPADHQPKAAPDRPAAAPPAEGASLDQIFSAPRDPDALDGILELFDQNALSVADLVARLGRGDTESTLLAARALAEIGTEEAVRALLNFARTAPDPHLLRSLNGIIQRIDNPQAAPALWETATSSADPTSLRGPAQVALSRQLTGQDYAMLLHRFNSLGDPLAKHGVEGVVRQIQNPAQLPLLMSLAGPKGTAPANDLSIAAVQTMATVGTPEAISDLLDRLNAVSPAQQEDLLYAFEFVHNAAAFDVLWQAASGAAPGFSKAARLAAIKGLSGLPEQYSQSALQTLLSTERDPEVNKALLVALGYADEEEDEDGEDDD
jgi:HEAT repeat protein